MALTHLVQVIPMNLQLITLKNATWRWQWAPPVTATMPWSFADMIFLKDYYLSPFRIYLLSEIWIIIQWQTDRQTDRKRCIWAHRAICTGGLKNCVHQSDCCYLLPRRSAFGKKIGCPSTLACNNAALRPIRPGQELGLSSWVQLSSNYSYSGNILMHFTWVY